MYIHKCTGEDDYTTCRALGGLGSVYNMLGRYEDSYSAHSKCLVIKVRELGSEHIDVASSFFDIAITLKHLRRQLILLVIIMSL